MWKNRAVYIALLLSGAGMYVVTNKRQIFMLLLVLVLMPLISGLMLAVSAGGMRITCELQETCVVGQRIGVNMKVVYRGHLPIGRGKARIEYENILFRTMEKQVVWLERSQKKQAYYEIPYISRDCGKYKIKFPRVVCFDVMGLFAKKCRPVPEYEFTVFPKISELEISLKHLPESKTVGNHYNQRKKGQDVTEVFEMREYREGDNPKSIHWKLSGKLDQLIVREFSHPADYHTLVLYDTAFDSSSPGYHEIVNGVLGMTASISRSLVNMNHSHHVGFMNKESFLDTEVEDNDSFMQALTNMMSAGIGTAEDEGLDEFIRQDLQREFSKIVLVTGVLGEQNVQRLTAFVDLTVVLISEKETDNVAQGKNYDVIALAVDSMTAKVQMLDI